jgi:hypothetical protein
MSRTSVKRIDGDYKIFANKVTINANLDVIGTTTTIQSTNSTLKDRIIGLNVGETGAGVSAPGTSGIGIDRGTLPDVAFLWNENVGAWQITNDGTTYSNIATSTGTLILAGSDTFVQYNNAGALGADSNFRYEYNTDTLVIGNINLSGSTITTNVTNQNLLLTANGTGLVEVDAEIKLNQQVSDPSPITSSSLLYSKTPSTNGTGIYFVNSTASGEVASVNKSLLLSLIL